MKTYNSPVVDLLYLENEDVLTLSNDSHLYEAHLPLDYNHEFRF